MLSHLIQLLEENDGVVDLADVSRTLDAQPSAVNGMLETLIRMGRVIEIRPECGVCDTCSQSSSCTLPARRIKRYHVVHRRTAK
jgi:Mn-dependent DtxR family transcriptional regulator